MTTIGLTDGGRLVLHGFSAPDAQRGAVQRVDASGRVLWTVRPPEGEGQDAFVALRLTGDVVIADSFQGLSVRIDLKTGEARSSGFVK